MIGDGDATADRRRGKRQHAADVPVQRARGARIDELHALFAAHRIDTVVHLAAVVTPGPRSSRELEYSIDVLGTENVLRACLRAGVARLVYTSSGAAYGYHADNPPLLRESDPLRGNAEFAYAHHKRLVEEMLARARREHPELRQLVFRPGTILGERVASPITALFERPIVVGVCGSPAPFVLVWDEDVARGIVQTHEMCVAPSSMPMIELASSWNSRIIGRRPPVETPARVSLTRPVLRRSLTIAETVERLKPVRRDKSAREISCSVHRRFRMSRLCCARIADAPSTSGNA